MFRPECITRLSNHLRFSRHLTALTRWGHPFCMWKIHKIIMHSYKKSQIISPKPLLTWWLAKTSSLSWFQCALTAGQNSPYLKLEAWLSLLVDFDQVSPQFNMMVYTLLKTRVTKIKTSNGLTSNSRCDQCLHDNNQDSLQCVSVIQPLQLPVCILWLTQSMTDAWFNGSDSNLPISKAFYL